MLPDQWALHIKGNSLILRPLHGRILVLAPVRWKLPDAGGGSAAAGIVQLCGASRLFPQNVVDVLESLFEHFLSLTKTHDPARCRIAIKVTARAI